MYSLIVVSFTAQTTLIFLCSSSGNSMFILVIYSYLLAVHNLFMSTSLLTSTLCTSLAMKKFFTLFHILLSLYCSPTRQADNFLYSTATSLFGENATAGVVCERPSSTFSSSGSQPITGMPVASSISSMDNSYFLSLALFSINPVMGTFFSFATFTACIVHLNFV